MSNAFSRDLIWTSDSNCLVDAKLVLLIMSFFAAKLELELVNNLWPNCLVAKLQRTFQANNQQRDYSNLGRESIVQLW